ncbi:MAG TPA: ATP-binding protein, partial [Novosphingobium sp.]|nr:ATP-binding protein [Novosphingobium sp.]
MMIPGMAPPPFRSRLTELTLLVTALALLLSGVGLIAVQYSHERDGTSRHFHELAQVLAANLGAAVVFDDQSTAEALVHSAGHVPDIVWIDVDGQQGRQVASFFTPGMTAAENAQARRLALTPGYAEMGRAFSDFGYYREPIHADGRVVGMLVIGFRYRSFGQIARDTVPIAITVLAVSMAIAMAVSAQLNRMMMRPLDRMKAAMHEVRRSGDLKARVDPVGDPDFDDMIEGFNTMLGEIEGHNARLAKTMADLAEARDAAESASVAKSEFLANMSHELRTPLNAIIGYAEVLREDLSRVGMVRSIEDVGWICSSSQQLLELINSLLDLSKIEAGRMELDIHSYDLPRMLTEVEALLVPLAAKGGNTLTLRVDPALGAVMGDSTKLRQCLLNLGSNACKFTKDGFVELQARGEEGQLVFQVSDTGIGIAEADIARLFTPFVQSDSSTTRRFGGTGLGLALVERFTQMMGGTVSVSSEVGFGSVFTIRLPRDMTRPALPADAAPDGAEDMPAPATDTRPASATSEAPRRARPLALIVDDEPSSIELLRRMLERNGYDVAFAADGQAGLDMALAQMPDMILLDLGMPGMDGWTLLDQLSADRQLARIPSIVVSVDDRRRISIEKGASDHLVKPVRAEELEDILRLYARRRNGTILLAE